MLNALTSALFVVMLAALAIWLRPRQPQWVSRDRTRFISLACREDNGNGRPGRWTRVHGRIVSDGVRLRQSFLAASIITGTFRTCEAEESTDPRFEIFTVGDSQRVHLKAPAGGPLAAVLRSISDQGGAERS